jgi:HK97 family phage major capsid protein
MEKDQLQAFVDAQKSVLANFQKSFGSDMEAKLMTLVDGKVQPVSDTIKTVGDAQAELKKQLDSLEATLRSRSAGIVPGLADEAAKKGGISLMKVIPGTPGFDVNSEDWAMVSEHTKKARNLGGVEMRDLSHGVDSAGGVLVNTQMLPGFIEQAREEVVVWDPALITVLEGLTGAPVEIPRETGNTAAYWVGENEAPTKSDVTFGQIRFQPKKVAALVKISNRLLRLGTIAETVVKRNLTRTIGLEMDRVILRGLGSNGEPRGIAQTPGINTVAIGTNGGDFTFSVAQNMIYELEKDVTLKGKLGFVSHPGAFHKMKKERIAQYSGDTLGAYVILPMSDQNLQDHLGWPFKRTTVVPSNLAKGSGTNLTEVYFGNWKDAYLALWANLEFKASNVTGDSGGSALTLDQTWIYCFLEADVQLGRPTSFVLCNDANTV